MLKIPVVFLGNLRVAMLHDEAFSKYILKRDNFVYFFIYLLTWLFSYLVSQLVS